VEQGPLVPIVMPALGVSVAEGTLVQWRKAPGDPVEADEAVCDVATDKIDSELPAPCAGTIVELLVAAGETVDVGTVLATLEPLEPIAPTEPAAPAAEGAGAAEAIAQDAPAEPARDPRTGERHSRVVLALAAEHGVDVDTLVGTGAGGRVRREDVLAAAAGAGERYAPPAPVELSRMRMLIGEHMKRSLEVAATVTSWIEIDFSAIEARRRALGVTALPVVAHATIAVLAQFGDLNAWLDGGDFIRHEDVNLGIAVSLGEDGLIVPVIRGAHELEIPALAAAISDLAVRARAGTLRADEVLDGTFTITNPGQFGTVMATPVISQPQVAILDMEAIVRRPVVVTDADGTESVAIRPMCVFGLSWDHRALDGVYAARFLGALRARLESVD
jgi:pyruvate/2-oxoglutarate dehydrogenase complex dihydrolipoamide acyltransferase (E2) component